MLDHHRAKVVFELRRFIRKRAEHEPVDGFDTQPRQLVLSLVEVGRHSAFLLNALFERDARQVAVEIVNPVVVRAHEVVRAFALAFRLMADDGALVHAPVHQRVDAAIGTAHGNDRAVADARRDVIARCGDFDVEAQKRPGPSRPRPSCPEGS